MISRITISVKPILVTNGGSATAVTALNTHFDLSALDVGIVWKGMGCESNRKLFGIIGGMSEDSIIDITTGAQVALLPKTSNANSLRKSSATIRPNGEHAGALQTLVDGAPTVMSGMAYREWASLAVSHIVTDHIIEAASPLSELAQATMNQLGSELAEVAGTAIGGAVGGPAGAAFGAATADQGLDALIKMAPHLFDELVKDSKGLRKARKDLKKFGKKTKNFFR